MTQGIFGVFPQTPLKDQRFWRIGGSHYFEITKPWPTAEQVANTERLLGWKWCDGAFDPVDNQET